MSLVKCEKLENSMVELEFSASAEDFKAERADDHVGPQGEGEFAGVVKFEDDFAVPAGVDAVGGDVNHEAEAGQRGAAVEPADDVGGEADGFEGGGEGEFSGVEEEGVVFVEEDFVAHDGVVLSSDGFAVAA